MQTGFHSLKHLSKRQLKQFFKDAVMLSYDTHIEIKNDGVDWKRHRTTNKTIQEMLNGCAKIYHNVCIDRSIQYKDAQYGEIGYCSNINKVTYYLFIAVTLNNLKILVDKYNLIMN